MAEKKEIERLEEESPILSLVDENGKEEEFELLAEGTVDGNRYYAILAVKEQDPGNYLYVRVGEDENGETYFETVDDDDEFDKVDDFFNDLFFDEVDYDRK
jgi:uncharacterized protein YrzB (UPF0473 family)